MRGLILEGIPGSGKSRIYGLLAEIIMKNNHSLLAFSEHITERPLEPLYTATLQQSLNTLEKILSVLTMYAETPLLRSAGQDKFFLFERFHLSHCLDIAGFQSWPDYRTTEEKLKNSGAALILLTIRPENVLERSIVRTSRLRPASWRSYLQTLGDTDEKRAQYYIRQQEQFIELSSQSILPSYIADTTNENWEELTKTIYSILSAKS